ncbi:MAG: FadR family transcriptional regulator [Deltaproteobacteria bacterium]|nr:FadR family transcriptional regulator [Deltaproteobacteria bacterium]
MLKPIKPKRISDQVFEQLRDLIFKGHLKPGEKLLAERDLARNLGVSRPTVREAIHKLVAMRLLEHRQGQGTFVNSPSGTPERNPLSALMEGQEVNLVDLMELRLGLECNAAAFAAQRATDEDILELERSLEKQVEEVRGGSLGSDGDISFHMAIAFATKNTVHIHIMKSLYDLLFFGIKENLELLYLQPRNIERVIQQHTDVFRAIRDHDPDGASDAMKSHITFVLDFFREIQSTEMGSRLLCHKGLSRGVSHGQDTNPPGG